MCTERKATGEYVLACFLSATMNTIWIFLAYQEAEQARMSLHLSKYHIVGNHMTRLFNLCYCGQLLLHFILEMSTHR